MRNGISRHLDAYTDGHADGYAGRFDEARASDPVTGLDYRRGLADGHAAEAGDAAVDWYKRQHPGRPPELIRDDRTTRCGLTPGRRGPAAAAHLEDGAGRAGLEPPMTTPARQRPAQIRDGRIYDVEIGGAPVQVTITEFPGGQPGEVSLTAGKQGSTFAGMCDTVAITTSLAPATPHTGRTSHGSSPTSGSSRPARRPTPMSRS